MLARHVAEPRRIAENVGIGEPRRQLFVAREDLAGAMEIVGHDWVGLPRGA
jgi:hypothetical protein